MEFEIVYGHAVRPLPRAAMSATTSIGLDDMRTIMRARPRR
jgi:malonyl-CoA O-methyltransferase